MHRTRIISACTCLALLGSASHAQQIMMQFDADYPLPVQTIVRSLQSLKFDRAFVLFDSTVDKQLDQDSNTTSLALHSPSQGSSLNASSFADNLRALMCPDTDVDTGMHEMLVRSQSWDSLDSDPAVRKTNTPISFAVGRNTELRDGNISGSEDAFDQHSIRDHVPSIAQAEGEYDLYDLAVEWKAINTDTISFSVRSGLKAIEANIGKRITTNGSSTFETVNRFTAVPMIGSGVHWKINEAFSLSGSAMTHPINAGSALIDFNATTDLQLSSNVGLSAGYRMIRSSFDVGSVSTDLNQEGLFARLRIRF